MKLEDYEREHIERLRPYLAECCVLLKNKGDFPITDLTQIALYGSGVRGTIKGGTGSGEVNSRYYDTVETAFEKMGIDITTKEWLDSYDKVVQKAFLVFKKELKKKAKETHANMIMMSMGATMPAPEYELPLDGEGTVAVYVLSRDSGENTDRSVEKGNVLLTDTELRDIKALNQKYEHFMLVLNVGGVVDLSGLEEIDNILILSQLGVETGDALANIITGKANPSGKLATTWAEWNQYSDLIEFGGYDDIRYKEGIYVGYRYFDSKKVEPLYPFGYGLSYTTFEIGEAAVSNQGEKITVTIPVTNIGDISGKEVVQVYVSAPEGELDKEYQTLAGFKKTKELKPGETQELVIDFGMNMISSYNEASSAFILEAGRYIIRVGNSSRNTKVCGAVELKNTFVTRQVKKCLGEPDFDPHIVRRQGAETISEDAKLIILSEKDFIYEKIDYDKKYDIDPKVKELNDEELLLLAMGYFNPKGGIAGMIGNSGSIVAGTAGESAHVAGFEPVIMADGPAGIRIAKDYFVDDKGIHSMAPPMPESMLQFAPTLVKFAVDRITPRPKKTDIVKHQYCTAIPIGTAIAQSWNEEFANICGDIVGREMEIFNIDLWLAPALNIHRSILCGRNFEYYSEDPLISGKMAAAITRGVQSHKGKGVTIKHFAANNQEYNRTSSNSIVSERAMREIYLRGFEICVKEAAPKAIMSSYNLINGKHTSMRKDLLGDILRSEFGFEGIIMTDWIISGGMIPKDAKHKSPHPADIAAAGGDLYMPGSKADYKKLKEGYRAGLVSREQLEINATRLYRWKKS